ncbi:CDP-paratose 2-epimerase [Ruminococcaceae bacterium R-25]|nr:CDP-paratose 2-epimerase [Ruminococcaceae bacterium R-25]SUQ11880.1 CDP-paratose 2-epimerase [Oscillospiraceae bacterium]
MKILINGGCGFLGSNLASYAIEKEYDLTVFDNMSRLGSDKNREWLNSLGNYTFIHGDTRVKNDVEQVIREGQFDVIFHLAGQVTMTKSISDPYRDFQTNAIGALNVLEAIRKYSPQTAIFFSSTNKVYGDLEQYTYTETSTRYMCDEFPNGFDESVPLDFRSPYGCSKGCADQYMLDYSRIFGVKSVVFRHSSMYGSRQFATYDQGWVGWFVAKAIEKYQNPQCDPFTISGNGKQVRDLLEAEDMVKLYFTAYEHIDDIYGQAFNIGGTMSNALSLLELFAMLEELLGIKMDYVQIPPRQSDQKVFVADISKINRLIGWKPEVSSLEGVSKMIEWVKKI